MAETTINTRLVLRNAELSAWEKSTVKLLKGEMALAQLSGDQAGSYKVRIGTGDKTWNELSDQGQLVIPVENVEGLTAAIQALSTSYYETDDIAKLSATYVNGDVAVEKKTIAGDKQEYCAYRYNTSVSAWQALDGNYSAENVYFKSDITLAGDYTAVGNIKLSDNTLAASGKSVKTLMENIFTKELSGTYTKPSFTFSANGGTAEVGATYTVPTATFKYTDTGSYTYEPKDAACAISAGQVTIARTTSGETTTKTNTAAIAKNGTLTCDTGSTKTYTDSTVTYNYSLSAEHTQGVMPKTNLGNDIPAYQIAAGDNWAAQSGTTNKKTASASFTGWRRCFWGYRTAAEGAITEFNSDNIRNNIHATGTRNYNTDTKSGYTQSNAGNNAFILKFKVLAGTKQLIFAVPHTLNTSTYVKCTMINTSIGQLQLDNNNNRQTDKCTVNGLNSYSGGDYDKYDIWTYTAEGSFAADTEYSITWSAS